jgi:hypothetical protein
MAKFTLSERIIRRLGGLTRQDLEAVRGQAFTSGVREGMEINAPNDEPSLYDAKGLAVSTGYKSVKDTPRDLSQWSQEKAIEATYRLWNSNPLAYALTEIVVDYVIGSAVGITSGNEQVQEALDRFCSDPVNDLLTKDGSTGAGLEAMARELGLFGEQLILIFPRDGAEAGMTADGLVRLAPVDPGRIYSLITDEQNKRDVLAVKLKGKNGGDDGPVYLLIKAKAAGQAMEGRRDLGKLREYVKEGKTERMDETLRTVSGQEWVVCEGAAQHIQEAEGDPKKDLKADGECFLFQVNRISTGLRGRPDLLGMIDWLDRYDQLFFDGAEHVSLLNMFSWDLTIQNGAAAHADPELNLNTQAQKVAKMKSGSVYAHNQNAALEAKNPDLKTSDIETIIRQLRVFITGGRRIPEHWISEGGYTNRATATEMGQPTYKMLERRQGAIKSMITKLCQYQIDVLVGLGKLPERVPVLDEDGEPTGKTAPTREAFSVDLPDINVDDSGAASKVLQAIAQSVLPLVAGKIITKEVALKLTAQAATLLGVEIDVAATLEEMADEEAANPAPEPGADGKPGTGGKQSLIDLLDQLIGDQEPGTNGRGSNDASSSAA